MIQTLGVVELKTNKKTQPENQKVSSEIKKITYADAQKDCVYAADAQRDNDSLSCGVCAGL